MSDNRNPFWRKPVSSALQAREKKADKEFIEIQKHVPKITINTNIVYEGEQGINFAYCDLDSAERLRKNEKRIFVFRSDQTIALGVKNAEWDKQTFETKNIVPAESRKFFFNPLNRYGHPGLALPVPPNSATNEPAYDGSVYYAGWIAQRKEGSNRDAHGDKLVNRDPHREKHIEIFLVSGRFMFPDENNKDAHLTPEQTKLVEEYIAKRIIERWGPQNIHFMDFKDKELPLYLQNKPHSAQRAARIYKPEDLFNKNELESLSSPKELTPGSKKLR